MNYKQHLHNLYNYLSPFQLIWDQEIIHLYPAPLDFYRAEWIDALNNCSDDEIYKLDAHHLIPAQLPLELRKVFIDGQELVSSLERTPLLSYVANAPEFTSIKEKKIHEITQLKSLVKNIAPKQLLDIGGGIGNLANTLSQNLDIDVTTIDMDVTLQETGKRRFGSNQRLKFHTETFNEKPSVVDSYFKSHDCALGLHTCGGLATTFITKAIKHHTKNIISIGCCYLKLQNSDQNLSQEAKELNLMLSKYALTLASRSHSKKSEKDFYHKMRVKQYRYGLHLFLYHELGIRDFQTVGDSKPRIYALSFPEYLKIKLAQLNLTTNLSDSVLIDFYKGKSGIIHKMFLGNVLRWSFGRMLEHYLLTDRAIFFEEHGYGSKMVECFDEEISPRNIAIIGSQN